MQSCLLAVALFTCAEAGIWRGFSAQRPSTGFLGDTRLSEPHSDFAKMAPEEFQATYKKPRAEKRVSTNFTMEMNATKDGSKIMPKIEINTIEKTEKKDVTVEIATVEKTEKKDVTTSGSKLKIMTKDDAAFPAAPKKKAAEPASTSKRSRRGNREVTLIESLQHMGGDEAVGCVTHCRYDEFMRHSWQECLDRCVENRLMRSAMLDMLPSEDHDAHHHEKEVPKALQDQMKKHRARMEEL